MGSVTSVVDVPASIITKDELKKWWSEYIERTEDMYGTAYDNGYLTQREGIVFMPGKYTREKAVEYVDDHGVKRGSVFAFWMTKQNVDFSKVHLDLKVQEASTRLRDQTALSRAVINGVLYAERKQKKVTCPTCHSNVSTSYTNETGSKTALVHRTCPVCKTGSLLSKGDTTKIEKAEAAMTKAQERLNKAQEAAMAKVVKAADSFEAWTVIGIAAT